MDRKKKIRLMLFFVFEVLTVFIVCGGVIYLVRYQIRNKYNVRPEKICNRYLEKTYGKKFTMIDKTYISNYRDYHVWGFKYKDEEGIEFWEYYGYPYEYVTGSTEWFYNEEEYGEDHIRDNYWWTVLRNGDEFNLETYEFVDEFGLWGYVFPLEDEKDIEQLVQMISRLYIYTLNHVKEVSSQVIFCKIKFQENIRGHIISDDWMNLTDEEEIYNFVYEQIREAWEEREVSQSKISVGG